MCLIYSRQIVALEPWSDLLDCHVGVRADVLRGMPVGIPAWQAKRLLHGTLDKVRHLSRRPPVPRPREVVLLWGSLASCVPVGNRHARRLPIAAQDAILPH
jgi:hypothetical protein